MGFTNGSYAKVWEINHVKDNVTRLRISISAKNKETGQYEQEFGGYCVLFGTALAQKAAAIKQGDRIKLTRTDVRNRYEKETKKEYTDFIVWEFEPADGSGATAKPASAAPAATPDPQYQEDDQTLPF